MTFFQLADGRSVKLDEIEAVERIDDLNCRVFTENHEYEAKIPYSTMVSILENYADSKDSGEEVKLLQQISNKVGDTGSFAG